MTATGGCTGRTFEEEAVRIARSGNYEYVRNHVLSGLLRRAEGYNNSKLDNSNK